MFKSHILKYRVGIISMLVVMTCMIVCSVLFDSSGEVEADSTSKESDVEAASYETFEDVNWDTDAPAVLGRGDRGDHHARAYADTHP